MEQTDYIIVVSGLPRSGTSMMMKMLEAGGLPILTDNLRAPDANNPNGYYEFERVKQLPEGDYGWLPEAGGKVVKIVTGLIMHLPSDYKYKVIFMQRAMKEVLSSQKKMLGRLGKEDDRIEDEKMRKIYQEHLKQVNAWLAKQPNMDVLYVNYNTMLADPLESLQKVNEFLGGGMDVNVMAGVVNKELYRERKSNV
ncbi:MAG: sulfotransferase domain-containing protein [Anaerolineales bacterium]|nr:sulfotransferase domain-containing protein [Anaerolineales bacterium]